MKKIIGLFTMFLMLFNSVYAQTQRVEFPFDEIKPTERATNTDLGRVLKVEVVDKQDSVLARLLTAIAFPLPASYQQEPASAYIKDVINYFLGLVSFIALGVMIYGFYMMFFSDQEKGLSKAKNIVRGASIAIAIMFLSRFVIDYLFAIFAATKTI